MNLMEISQEIGVSVRVLRKVITHLRKLGLMPQGDRISEINKMKNYLSIGAHLPVEYMVLLLEHPDLIKAMGEKGKGAKAQLETLGDVPRTINSRLWPLMRGAAAKEQISLEQFEAWAKATIPEKGCTYHYLAVRIVMAAPEAERAGLYGRLRYAFLQLRMLPSFAGWFTVDRNRKRPTTFYHRPKEIK